MWGLLVLFLIPNVSLAAPNHVRVFAEGYERSQQLTPTPTLLPLPFSQAQDSTGRSFTADAEGRLDLSLAQGAVTVSMHSPYFLIFRQGQAFSQVITPDSYRRGSDVVFTESHAPLGARMARAHLERARLQTISALPREHRQNPFFHSVTLITIDSAPGCNAFWFGSQILFYSGDASCRSASENSDIIYHEYAHGITNALRSANGASNESLNEGFSDIFALLLTGDPRFAQGVTLDPVHSAWRNLAVPMNYPTHYRGRYSGGLVMASAWAEFLTTLEGRFTSARARAALTQAFLAMVAAVGRETDTNANLFFVAGEASVTAISENSFLRRLPGIRCWASRVFASHGLVALPNDCAEPIISRTQIVSSDREGRGCGSRILERAHALSEEGEWLATTETTSVQGARGNPREILTEILRGPAPITDPRSHLVTVPPTELPFSIPLQPTEKVVDVWLEIEIDHPLSHDIAISFRDARGQIHPIYRGIEEVSIPGRLRLPLSGTLLARNGRSLRGTILVEDRAPTLSGSVMAARLLAVVVPTSCR